jgi:hypothetical protein
MNETKWYELWSKLKLLVLKTHNLLPKVAKGLGKSWLEFDPFCMNETQQIEVKLRVSYNKMCYYQCAYAS